MSARAVLNTAYTLKARRADALDDSKRLSGSGDDATARYDLDRALGLIDELGEDDSETNVVELAAFIHRVNATMQ